jgi:cytochrome b subunit of formate dehydrogenase
MYITNVLHWIMISCILQMFYTGLEFHVSYKGFTNIHEIIIQGNTFVIYMKL